MLIHPQFDPIAVSIGPLAVRWYGLMYLAGFVAFLWLGKRRASAQPWHGMNAQDVDDLLFYGVLGVVLGGRLGQVLFYEPGYYLDHPLEILAVWKGGMAFHGGMLGVFVAMALWGRKTGRAFFQGSDFINGELWGRVADATLPWAMVFPHVDRLPRHPSPLYQAAGEGLLLFIVLWLYSARQRAVGAVSGVFMIGYGALRFIAEYFREPDHGIFGVSYVVSMGQWLSLPMILFGLWLLLRKPRPAKVGAGGTAKT